MTVNESMPPAPEPEVKPSTTPDGPQIIPAPSTPPGEPSPDPKPETQPNTDLRASDPNAGGEAGLAGAMGVSSERIPGDPDSIEGTGSRGSAVDHANGSWNTLNEPGRPEGDEPETDDRPHPQDPAEGPEMDDRQQEATQEWRDGEPPAKPQP